MSSAKQLGERRIISIIFKSLDIMPNTPVPFGDDVSAVEINNRKLAVIKTDMLVGKTDVPPHMNLWQAARKSVVMNISDLAAKGVKPIAVLAALGISPNIKRKEIEQIGKGLNDGAREYGAYVLGGDTNEASDLIISCTAFGIVEKGLLIRRKGAKQGDIVATTGLFGKTASGLKILLENFEASSKIKNKLIDSVLMPHARLKEGLALAETRAVTSSIDSSDGLACSLHEISKASDTGFVIDTLPIDPEVKEFAEYNNLDPIELVLYGGEEYELLVTVEPKLWEKVEEVMKNVGTPLKRIGCVTKEQKILFKTRDKTILIERRGWEHFRSTTSEMKLNLG